MNFLQKQFGEFFELPAEVIQNFPLVMLAGSEKLFLENHKGIALYQSDLIKIRINSGLLIIKGKNLNIEEIETDKINVTGEISGLSYEVGGSIDD